jgi:hypothetical protein
MAGLGLGMAALHVERDARHERAVIAPVGQQRRLN